MVAATALLGLAWLARTGDLDRSDKFAVVGLAVGLAGVLLAIPQARAAILQLRGLSPVAADDQAVLDRAAERLATSVRVQWQAEAGLRGLHRPEPLRLAWTATTRPVAAPANTIAAGTVAGRVVRLRLHGHLDEVADKFLALPRRRLIVLGAPGAGKTVLAMLLALALLDRRQPHQPVPVLLSLSQWEPTAEHLHAWLARRLSEDYPALRSPGLGPDAAQRLLAAGRVLPLLDGLDELPKPACPIAITELDRAHGDQPLVLTSRAAEFEQAAAGGALAAAAVVELEPVTAGQAAAFLRTSAAPPVAARWDQVAEHLHAHPDGELALALSTPLGVALARTVYATPTRDPAELVALAQAAGRAAVEGHLLEGFIPAAFAALPQAPGSLAPPRRWDPQAARRWLRVLAVHLDRRRTRDLAWWQLHRLLPAGIVHLSVVLLVVLLSVLLGGLLVGLAGGLVLGLLGGLGVGLLREIREIRAPTQVDTRIRGRPGVFLALLACSLTVVYTVVRSGGPTGGFVAGVMLAFVLDLWLRQPVDTRLAVTPRSVHHGERTVTIVGGLAFGLAFGLGAGLAFGLGAGLGVGFGVALTSGLAGSAWGRFTVVRGWLALRGRLPWRLLRFLDDAHRLGVLRQAGAVYQFRHALLQDHLARSTTPPIEP